MKISSNQKAMIKLAKRIHAFLDKYAAISPDWDGQTEDKKFTSPDAGQMKYCADILLLGVRPRQCFSEWGSGGYKPYTSKEGRKEHDELISEIYKIINETDKIIK